MRLTVTTTPLDGGLISQEVFSEIGGEREVISRRLMNTMDEQVRAALVALGWLPPGSPSSVIAEPVAWRYQTAKGIYRYRGYVAGFDTDYAILRPVPLYLAPPSAVAAMAKEKTT